MIKSHKPRSVGEYFAPEKHRPSGGAAGAVDSLFLSAASSSRASGLCPLEEPCVASRMAVDTRTRTIRRKNRLPINSTHITCSLCGSL